MDAAADNRTLDPIGRVMQDAHDFSVRVGGRPMENPGLGVMLTPIALITDPMQGFIPPRTNYNPALFQSWGNRPYEPADYFTHACYDLLYPGYADCAYFLDEKGYTTPTPYGDGADVLTSDVMPWVLSRYSIALVVSDLEVGLLEVRMKLRQFVLEGGSVVITADNLLKLPPAPTRLNGEFDAGGLFGVWGVPDARTCRTQHPANTTVTLMENNSIHSIVVEPFSWVSCELNLPGVLRRCKPYRTLTRSRYRYACGPIAKLCWHQLVIGLGRYFRCSTVNFLRDILVYRQRDDPRHDRAAVSVRGSGTDRNCCRCDRWWEASSTYCAEWRYISASCAAF